MRSESSTVAPRVPPDGTGGASIALPIPALHEDLFKHRASAPILNFLADIPEATVSIRQLSRVTPVTERATREAVDALEASGLVETTRQGTSRQVGINRDRLERPADPIGSVPQVPYRTPVRVARHYIEDELEDVLGIVLFGSVARGDADRQSDIDLWILVADDLLAQRHAATTLARDLEGLQIPPEIALREARNESFTERWPEIRDQLEGDDREWAAADRHSFEFVVETPASILGQSSRVDPAMLFGEGITLYSTDTLDRVRLALLDDE